MTGVWSGTLKWLLPPRLLVWLPSSSSTLITHQNKLLKITHEQKFFVGHNDVLGLVDTFNFHNPFSLVFCKEQCHVHAGKEHHARPGWTTSRHGQDSLRKSQSKWQRTGITGKSTSMVWPTLGSRTTKEQNRLVFYCNQGCKAHHFWTKGMEQIATSINDTDFGEAVINKTNNVLLIICSPEKGWITV